MNGKTRTAIYLRQSGRKELTGRQRKRLRQKDNKGTGSAGGRKAGGRGKG
ncbi:hypothetical protein SAMN04489712_102616 [Thermomonospora echinospora]|uniref:Uncharacterized protein n=1 Tax=Thermomonospora echinospora TaxID=1992 RepID=A0A1H5W7X0_9ACTN|nr:hypothetical protein [Thermomonospora echinospora]SEF95316.1 hypothetical protein SAMN04489712_102616 [Thermomonospora echinospora]